MTRYKTGNGLISLEMTVESIRHQVATVLSENEVNIEKDIQEAVDAVLSDVNFKYEVTQQVRRQTEELLRSSITSAIDRLKYNQEFSKALDSFAANTVRKALEDL